MRVFCSVLQLLFALFLQSVIVVSAVCPRGFFDLNGLCVQEATSCPENYVLVNGMCSPAAGDSNELALSKDQKFVNRQLCTIDYILRCQVQQSCCCCGSSRQFGNVVNCGSWANQPRIPCEYYPNQTGQPCPNQPVSPYPNQPWQPCPNQPVTSYPNQPGQPCPNQPVTPYPNQPGQPCPNQPVTPYPNQPGQPCPNQPVTPYPNQPQEPCPNQPVTPYPNQPQEPYPNQPVTPYPNRPQEPCPNQPVTPYPTQTVTPLPDPAVTQTPNQPSPNQPVTPYPSQTEEPHSKQPVTPYPNQTEHPQPSQPVTPCPPQPVTPYPNQPEQPNSNNTVTPYPNQPEDTTSSQPETTYPNQPEETSTNYPKPSTTHPPITPYPNQPDQPTTHPVTPLPEEANPTAPNPTQPESNLPTQPYPNQPSTTSVYPNQPTTTPPYPIKPSTPSPQQPVTPVSTSEYPPTTAYPPTNSSSSTTTSTTPTIHVTITSTTTEPTTAIPTSPPAAITRCPAGTVLINGVCRLIYCGSGIYKDNRCIHTVCPHGTVWTGIRCAPPEPVVHSIVFNNTVITHFNHTTADVYLNNVNNIIVNATLDSPPSGLQLCEESEEDDCGSTAEPAPVSPPTLVPRPEQKCCIVITPRMCQPNAAGTRWNCYSRRYQRCGDFCIAPKIFLKASELQQTASYTLMPPNPEFSHCRQSRTCAESQNFYDCSGCILGHLESCSSYCYSYGACATRNCQFYDQRAYCSRYPGENGCQEQDGCNEDWCFR